MLFQGPEQEIRDKAITKDQEEAGAGAHQEPAGSLPPGKPQESQADQQQFQDQGDREKELGHNFFE
jgi:hypothetical protein